MRNKSSGKIKGFISVISITGVAIIVISLVLWPGITGSAIEGKISKSRVLAKDLYSTIASAGANGYQAEKVAVTGSSPVYKVGLTPLSEADIANGINMLSDVPAFNWSYGSAATSAAMLFGYYDRAGYSNMYAGPANDGVCPMDNSIWGATVYDGGISNECPLSASHQGIDGRVSKGHVDDYWIGYENDGPDPYISNEWAEHSPGDCTGDFMGTSQSSFQNADGSTFFHFESDGSAACDYTECEPDRRDGCHGMRLFAESRGYNVVANFSQYIMGYNGLISGFTFDDFQAEIDAGRPVLIHVKGVDDTEHVMLGYGYDTTGSAIYLHDTWDQGCHTMTWGGAYYGMQHYGVTVIQMAVLTPPAVTTNNATGISADSATLNGHLDSLGGYNIVNVAFEWGTLSGNLDHETAPQEIKSAGAFTSNLSSLVPNSIYYYRAKAAGDITVYGSEFSFSCDNIEPAVNITEIPDFVNTLASISGTAYDTFPGELQKVQVLFMNTSNITCWNGNDWVSTETWLDASGTASWSYTLPDLDDGQNYQVKIKSIDMAGNESSENASTFTFDTGIPSVTIRDIDYFVNDLASVSGTAFDTLPGELQKVQMVFINNSNSEYWDGNNWVSTETWLDVSGTTYWSYDLPVLGEGKTYQIKAKSIDMAGNESSEYFSNFTFDTGSPTVTITDIDDFVNDLVSVSGTASDTLPGELQKVQILLMNSNNSIYWDGSEWITSEIWLDASGNSSWNFVLPDLEDGITYQFKAITTDKAGNQSAEVTDIFTIYKDKGHSTIDKWLIPGFITGGITVIAGVFLFRHVKRKV